MNRLIKTIYPDGFYESLTYDQSGKIVNRTARNGLVTTSSYDSSGKLFRIESLNDTIYYSFDADGKTFKVKNSQATIYYSYNNRELISSMS